MVCYWTTLAPARSSINSRRICVSKSLLASQPLSKLFGLSDEQLDYVINYDIKYRMGLNGAEDDADD